MRIQLPLVELSWTSPFTKSSCTQHYWKCTLPRGSIDAQELLWRVLGAARKETAEPGICKPCVCGTTFCLHEACHPKAVVLIGANKEWIVLPVLIFSELQPKGKVPPSLWAPGWECFRYFIICFATDYASLNVFELQVPPKVYHWVFLFAGSFGHGSGPIRCYSISLCFEAFRRLTAVKHGSWVIIVLKVKDTKAQTDMDFITIVSKSPVALFLDALALWVPSCVQFSSGAFLLQSVRKWILNPLPTYQKARL